MLELSRSDLLSIVIAVLAVTSTLAALLLAYRANLRSRYDQERQRAELGALRDAIEGRMYELNARLVSTQERWQEANHLVVSSQRLVPDDNPARAVSLPRFFRSSGLPERLEVEPDLVFVLTPFHEKYEPTFRTIVEVCRTIGLRCMRGDEEFVQADLLPHILQMIARARVIIANVDGRNPNVFYELGLAHALDKTTLIVSRSVGDLPFDLRTKKLVMYQDQADLHRKLQAELARILVFEATAGPEARQPRNR